MLTKEQQALIEQAKRYADTDDYQVTRDLIRGLLGIIHAQSVGVPAYYICKPGTFEEELVSPEAVNGFCRDCVPLYTAVPNESIDAKLGRIAMRFVDRAGDPDPEYDSAERICAEFYKAISDVVMAEQEPPK